MELEARTWPGLVSSVLGDAPWTREDARTYQAGGGYAPAAHGQGNEDLADLLKEVGMRGRGGAAFPTAIKLEAVRSAASPEPPVLVANGAEGEPLSFKDRYLMRYRPHRVLDGLLACARWLGSDKAVVYTCDQPSAQSMSEALQERPTTVPITVVYSEHAYVAGEETAVVDRLSGGFGLPRDKPPRPFQVGVDGRPTAVLNVDTLWQVAQVLTERPDGWQASFLASVTSTTGQPTLYEVPCGIALSDLARDFRDEENAFSATILGGFFGGLLPASRDMLLDFKPEPGSNTALGCGSFYFVDREIDCPIAAAADIADYLARHNARQCGPCVRGSSSAASALRSISLGQASTTVLDDIARWAAVLPGRGACAVPDGLARLLRCLLEDFATELQAHCGQPCSRCHSLSVAGHSRARFRATI
jgi:NADH:ubiquinone oxidoreductase subunit F (NADH-binding)